MGGIGLEPTELAGEKQTIQQNSHPGGAKSGAVFDKLKLVIDAWLELTEKQIEVIMLIINGAKHPTIGNLSGAGKNIRRHQKQGNTAAT